MRGKARAEHRGHVIFGPGDDVDQRLPERLVLERRVRDVGARNDERIQALFPHVLETAVVALDVVGRLRAAIELRQGERVDEELGNPVAAADQPDELPLGGLQRRVGHHVEKADVQLADVLVHRAVERQHLVPLFLEVREGRQV